MEYVIHTGALSLRVYNLLDRTQGNMLWSLVIIMVNGVQPVGVFQDREMCIKTVAELRAQDIKAVCVQTDSPEQQFSKVLSVMSALMKEANK